MILDFHNTSEKFKFALLLTTLQRLSNNCVHIITHFATCSAAFNHPSTQSPRLRKGREAPTTLWSKSIMTAREETTKQKPKFTPRLLPVVVDQIAASEPEQPYLYQPKSNRLEDGWAPVTFGELANAINHVAHLVQATVKTESKDTFPTLVYVGPNDVRTNIVLLAAVKAGCQAFFISPRNTPEMQRSLLQHTNCKHVWYAESLSAAVQTWTQGQAVSCWQVPEETEWLRAQTTPFPYTKTFGEARFDPLVVLHTSGSTGVPKPIVMRQGAVAVHDDHRVNLAPLCGGEYIWNFCSSHATRMLSVFPPFHAGGVLTSLISPIYFKLPLALTPRDQPLTAELGLECLKHSGSDAAFIPPSILEELTTWEEGLNALGKLNYVTFGGGTGLARQLSSPGKGIER
ncbi:hypothetical protein E4U42_000100 [Claviceps africana]|uniref:AMP-dependent synthetase/ligase domain-containing protein n=1 Tax=Claviceps africana TaxID=83212 RepID=A0A8K0J0D5_9HYPO|nr:hypothetical protein E4U42_000100 [Claviceps africana]